MAILKKIFYLTLPLFLTGCYEDFYPTIDTEPVLCLNSLITAGSPISVKISHTWVYTDPQGEKDHSVDDAELKIFVNDALADQDYIAKEGDRIRIEAFSPKYGAANAEVTVPYAEKIEKPEYTLKIKNIWAERREGWGVNADTQFDVFIAMDFPVIKDAGRFYWLQYDTYFPNGLWTDEDNDYDFDWNDVDNTYDDSQDPFSLNFSSGHFEFLDPVFYENVTAFDDVMNGNNGSLFFSDRQFTGDVKTLDFGFSSCFFTISGWDMNPEDTECGWELTLYSISESFYKWFAYGWQADGIVFADFANFGLADPIWGYSNVSTGAGVVAAQSSTKFTINIGDALYKAISEALSE